MTDLHNLDLIELVAKTTHITDEINVSELPRLQEVCHSTGKIGFTVKINANKKNKPILILTICGKIIASCQSCLQPSDTDIDIEVKSTIYNNQQELEKALLDKNNIDECDALVASSSFNLLELIEDELILSLPIAIRHKECQDK